MLSKLAFLYFPSVISLYIVSLFPVCYFSISRLLFLYILFLYFPSVISLFPVCYFSIYCFFISRLLFLYFPSVISLYIVSLFPVCYFSISRLLFLYTIIIGILFLYFPSVIYYFAEFRGLAGTPVSLLRREVSFRRPPLLEGETRTAVQEKEPRLVSDFYLNLLLFMRFIYICYFICFIYICFIYIFYLNLLLVCFCSKYSYQELYDATAALSCCVNIYPCS